MKTESQIITDIYDNGRKLAHFFIGKLQGTDMLKEFEAEGKKLNCAHWIIAHMTWAEDALLLKAMGEKGSGITWLPQFKIGSSPEEKKDWPGLDEVMSGFNEVHALSMKFVLTLSADQLDEKIHFALFNSERPRRDILYHAIRHESCHVGHLSWLCKLNGIKTV